MRIRDTRNGWQVDGQEVGRIPAHMAPTVDEMLAFYELKPGDRKYVEMAQPIPYDRVVVMKLDQSFTIVPINPQFYSVEV
jgi:hypothetical protein